MYVMGFIFIQRKTFTNYIMYVTYCNKCMRIYRSNNIFNFTISFLATTQYNTFRSTFVYDPTAFKRSLRSISDKILQQFHRFIGDNSCSFCCIGSFLHKINDFRPDKTATNVYIPSRYDK